MIHFYINKTTSKIDTTSIHYSSKNLQLLKYKFPDAINIMSEEVSKKANDASLEEIVGNLPWLLFIYNIN
jgi:hypothetical protein